MKYILALAVAITSCGGPEEPEVGWRPLEGTEYLTPKYGLSFWWVGPGGAYSTPEAAGEAIDKAYQEWVGLDVVRYPDSNLSLQSRLQAIQGINIQLFTGSAVRGLDASGDVYTLGIYWPWQRQIDTAMATPYHYDEWLKIYTQGLEQLKHEWSHVLRGAGHD